MVILLLLDVAATGGDAEVAEFLFKKAQKALRARDYDEAAAGFQRALDENSPYPDAAYGLGQALEKAGRASDAAAAYQLCLEQIGDPPPRDQRSLARRATTAISRLRRRYAALDRLNRAFVKDCLTFGRKYAKSDPDCARRAFEAVLQIDPANADAKRGLAKLPTSGASKPTGGKGEKDKGWVDLIGLDSLRDWSPGQTANWDCDDGVITGEAEGRADGRLNWNDAKTLKGEYSLRVSFRVIESDDPTYGVFVGDGSSRWWSVIYTEFDSLVLEWFEAGKPDRAEIAYPELDRKEWHTVVLDVKGKRCTVTLNGKEMFTHEDARGFAGKPALFVQDAKIEIRNVEVKE